MTRASITPPSARTLACLTLGAIVVGAVACGGPGAAYPSRPNGCPLKAVPGDPPVPVDDLGTVTVDCASAGGACQRQLMDAVCQRGGDLLWGLGDNTLTSVHPVGHAAHTKRATQGPHERGCAVQVFTEVAPGIRTENIGTVQAICDANDSQDVCLRELEDQVCLIGGDVLWQVEGPMPSGDKQKMRGRAAHTK
jgi:hypothetical protein